MKSGTTYLSDQAVVVFGLEIILDIEVSWTSDPGVYRDSDGAGCPPTLEIDGYEYDEDDALAFFAREWMTCEPANRPLEVLHMDEAAIKAAISGEVLKIVEKSEEVGQDE